MTPEARKARRQDAIARVRNAIKERVHHTLRPMDADDKEAACELATALLVGARDGYSEEERAAIEDLMDAWKEARSNTP